MKAAFPTDTDLAAYLAGELGYDDSQRIEQALELRPELRQAIERMQAGPLASRLQAALPAARYAHERDIQRAAELARRVWKEADTVSRVAPEEPTGSLATHLDSPTPPPKHLREYELLDPLGSGGMGTVYKALHTRLGKIVAIKLLPRERLRDAATLGRFEREMKAAGAIEHPHIVRATDAGEVDGIPFLVMEYVPGCDLSRLLAMRGPLRVADACEIVRQACLGLQRIHEAGLVHRDIKPSNVMLTPEGETKLLDLGLARWQAESAASDLTHDRTALGTLDYLSPEQAADARSADIRSDLYSLGCTLYKLLSGQTPFGASERLTPQALLLAHATATPRSLTQLRADVAVPVAEIVKRLLAKRPSDRFATPVELAQAVAPWCAGADLPALFAGAPPATPRNDVAWNEPQPSALRKRVATPWITFGLVALLLAAVVCGVVVMLQLGSREFTLHVDDPTAQLKVDGQQVMIDGQGIGKVKLSAGPHRWTIERDGIEVQGPEEFEVVRGENRPLRITARPLPEKEKTVTPPEPVGTPPLAEAAPENPPEKPEQLAMKLVGFADRLLLTESTTHSWQPVRGPPTDKAFAHLEGVGAMQFVGPDAKQFSVQIGLQSLNPGGKFSLVIGDTKEWHPELHFEHVAEQKRIRVRLLRRRGGQWFFPGDVWVPADLPHEMELRIDGEKTTLLEHDRVLKVNPSFGRPTMRIESSDKALSAVIDYLELHRLGD
jgi:serine/threonine protein kinase